jgi:hypothetical protein
MKWRTAYNGGKSRRIRDRYTPGTRRPGSRIRLVHWYVVGEHGELRRVVIQKGVMEWVRNRMGR